MLKNRIIPCLDVKNGRVVKGINFVDLKDAGDPVEQAKIYSDGGADEICFLDITASNENRDTIYDVVKKTESAQKTIDFILHVSEENITDNQVFIGEFEELVETFNFKKIYYKEHPLNKHYRGIEEPRDWMFDVRGFYPSFFAFWKKCKKQLNFWKGARSRDDEKRTPSPENMPGLPETIYMAQKVGKELGGR